jgi:hypothetical protein
MTASVSLLKRQQPHQINDGLSVIAKDTTAPSKMKETAASVSLLKRQQPQQK